MENYEWVMDVFAFIGMIVCIIIALIAIVWATCFAVKLLVKTFAVRVGKSYDVMVEDIAQKSEAKKERKELARKAAAEKKMELLNMKLESKQKIHEMKKQKLAESLAQKEADAKLKILGEEQEETIDTFEPEVESEIVKVYEEFENTKKQSSSKKGSKKSKKKEVVEDLGAETNEEKTEETTEE